MTDFSDPAFEDWCRRQLRVAYALAVSSPDPSTQNGAAVFDPTLQIVGSGCNRFPYGVAVTPDLLERPTKYDWIEHAERDALYATLRTGAHRPHLVVCAWAACPDCARAIVQSGVHVLVRHAAEGAHWAEAIATGDAILAASGVRVLTVDGPLGGCAPVLRNGVELIP